MTRRLFAVVILALALGSPVLADVVCAIDKSSAYFTGKTTTDKKTGKLLKEYKCNRNAHVFWVVS